MTARASCSRMRRRPMSIGLLRRRAKWRCLLQTMMPPTRRWLMLSMPAWQARRSLIRAKRKRSRHGRWNWHHVVILRSFLKRALAALAAVIPCAMSPCRNQASLHRRWLATRCSYPEVTRPPCTCMRRRGDACHSRISARPCCRQIRRNPSQSRGLRPGLKASEVVGSTGGVRHHWWPHKWARRPLISNSWILSAEVGAWRPRLCPLRAEPQSMRLLIIKTMSRSPTSSLQCRRGMNQLNT